MSWCAMVSKLLTAVPANVREELKAAGPEELGSFCEDHFDVDGTGYEEAKRHFIRGPVKTEL